MCRSPWAFLGPAVRRPFPVPLGEGPKFGLSEGSAVIGHSGAGWRLWSEEVTEGILASGAGWKLVYLQRWGAYHLSGHPFCLCKYTFPKALISLSLSSYL